VRISDKTINKRVLIFRLFCFIYAHISPLYNFTCTHKFSGNSEKSNQSFNQFNSGSVAHKTTEQRGMNMQSRNIQYEVRERTDRTVTQYRSVNKNTTEDGQFHNKTVGLCNSES